MKTIIVIVVLILSGCVSQNAILKHPETQKTAYCKNDGWGWLGVPLAIYEHNKCIKALKEKGYEEEK